MKQWDLNCWTIFQDDFNDLFLGCSNLFTAKSDFEMLLLNPDKTPKKEGSFTKEENHILFHYDRQVLLSVTYRWRHLAHRYGITCYLA